jgi:hypothetical protein
VKADYKIKIIYSLFAVSALAVAAIVVLNNFDFGKNSDIGNTVKSKVKITSEKIKADFAKAFQNWGVADEQVKFIKVDEKRNEVGEIARIVLPKDVTIDFILLELNDLLGNVSGVNIFAKDLPRRRKTEIKILANNKPLFIAFIREDKTLRRKTFDAVLIFDGRDGNFDKNLPESDFVKTAIIPINSAVAQKIKNGVEVKFDYAPVIDDEISEYKFSLEASLSKAELNASVSRILNAFGKDKVYFYDEHSELCSSPHFDYVKKRFERYCKIVPFSAITNLSNKTLSEAKAVIRLIIKGEKPNVFLLRNSQASALDDFFTSLWKKGVRFLTLTQYKNKGNL